MTRVLIADDQAAVRGGFAALIAAEDDLDVAGEAADGREALEATRRLRPQVVLMDIRMPAMDGLEATRLICADPALADTRVLVLTTFDLDEYVYGALRLGASGFLLKDAGPSELLHAIRTIAAGDALLAPGITKRLITEFAKRSQPAAATCSFPALVPFGAAYPVCQHGGAASPSSAAGVRAVAVHVYGGGGHDVRCLCQLAPGASTGADAGLVPDGRPSARGRLGRRAGARVRVRPDCARSGALAGAGLTSGAPALPLLSRS